MSFDLLHVLRLKGIVPTDAVASLAGRNVGETAADLERLASEGLVRQRETPRVSGWTLTSEGHARHAELLATQRSPETIEALTPIYERFFGLNDRVKALASSWQGLTPDDTAGRWEAVEELAEVQAEAAAIVIAAAGVVPRFAAYERRLAEAVERLRAGDERYFTGVTVESFHTVWFECHEDFIQTLGRDRIAEGSF